MATSLLSINVVNGCLRLSLHIFSDFDEDDFVSSADLRQVINRLTGEQQLSDEDMQQLINNVSDIKRC